MFTKRCQEPVKKIHISSNAHYGSLLEHRIQVGSLLNTLGKFLLADASTGSIKLKSLSSTDHETAEEKDRISSHNGKVNHGNHIDSPITLQ